jgi:ATP-dependent helicase HepA
MISVFDHYSVHVEEIAPRTYRLGSAGVFAETFPGLPTAGFSVTSDRRRALSREEIQFLTWDHPLVTGALDLLLGSEQGNSSFARWPDSKIAGLYLEAIYLIECVAPSHLHVDRFLPPTPMRVVVDHRGNDVANTATPEILARQLKRGNLSALLDQRSLLEDLVPELIGKAREIAQSHIPELVKQARLEMNTQLDHEIQRLRELRKINLSVRAEEIELLEGQQRAIEQQLTHTRLRLDALRWIQRGPV